MSFYPNGEKWIEKLEYLHPEGVKYTSPGQRPGNMGTQYVLALKGRNIVNHFGISLPRDRLAAVLGAKDYVKNDSG